MQTPAKKMMFLLPYLTGGGERIMSHLSLHSPKNIEKVIVVFGGQAHFPYEGRIVSLDIPPSRNFFLKLFIFISAYFKFKKIVKKENPDFVVSLGTMTSILNILVSKKPIVRMGNPVVGGQETLFEKAYHFLVKILFNKAETIIVISRRAKEELVKKFNITEDKIKVIYNFVDADDVKKLAEEPLDGHYQEIFRHKVVINVANLVEQKGQEYLIKAFALVKHKIQDAKLVIIGEGPLEEKLKGVAKDLGLDKDVHFLGWQKNPFKFIAKSKVFALPSLWEGFGIVMLETMVCGVPIVAFDCNFGPREILAPELALDASFGDIFYADSGILLSLPRKDSPTRAYENLATAIIGLLNNESVRKKIIESAHERVKYFSKESFVKGYQFLWQ